MNLLQDMMPDWDWAKRGGLERDGLVLTARRATMLRHAMRMRSEIFLASLVSFTIAFGSRLFLLDGPIRATIAGACLGLAVLVYVLDSARRKAVMSSNLEADYTASSSTRIAVVALLTFPFVLFGLVALTRALLPENDMVMIFYHWLRSINPMVFCLVGPCICFAYEHWRKRRAAAASIDPEMDLPFQRADQNMTNIQIGVSS
jgi:hypothetical protein